MELIAISLFYFSINKMATPFVQVDPDDDTRTVSPPLSTSSIHHDIKDVSALLFLISNTSCSLLCEAVNHPVCQATNPIVDAWNKYIDVTCCSPIKNVNQYCQFQYTIFYFFYFFSSSILLTLQTGVKLANQLCKLAYIQISSTQRDINYMYETCVHIPKIF